MLGENAEMVDETANAVQVSSTVLVASPASGTENLNSEVVATLLNPSGILGAGR